MKSDELNKKRLDFPLIDTSIVVNIGGYHGDWAYDLYNKYKCEMYIYEPVNSFYKILTKKFKKDIKVHIFNYGLLDEDKEMNIGLREDGTSIYNTVNVENVKFKNISNIINDLKNIDLMEINAEGSEYLILDKIIKDNLIDKVNYYLIQFHHNVENTKEKIDNIRKHLEMTHTCLWNADLVFECWKRIK
jgi:FkbM family methyltransferase